MDLKFLSRKIPKAALHLAGLLLSLGAFGLAIYSIPGRKLYSAIAINFNARLVLVISLWLLSIVFQAWRWQVMLYPQKRVGFHQALKLFIMNRLTNLLLPFRAGEGVRVVAAKKLWNINVPYVIATVFNERILNLAFLAIMGFILTFFVPTLQKYQGLLLAAVTAIAGVVLWILWNKRRAFEIVAVDNEAVSQHLSNKGRLYKFAYRFQQGLAVFNSPPVLLGTLLTSLASWLCIWAALTLLAQNVHASQPAACALALILFTHVASLAHLTPSNVGPFQWGCILAYSFFGVQSADAVGSSLVFQAVRVAAAGLVGLGVLAGDAVLSLRARAQGVWETQVE